MPEGIFSTAAPTRAVFIGAVWRAAVILLRCPKKSSGLRFPRFFRPLRQHALFSSVQFDGRRSSSCGARKNHRACAFLDFFDRCANTRSLHLPQAAVARVARLVRIPSYDDKKNTKTVKNCFGVFGTPEGIFRRCRGCRLAALVAHGSENSPPGCFLPNASHSPALFESLPMMIRKTPKQ